jgi:hypothetical protein
MQYEDFHAIPGLDFTMMESREGFERKRSSELAWNKIDEKDFSR